MPTVRSSFPDLISDVTSSAECGYWWKNRNEGIISCSKTTQFFFFLEILWSFPIPQLLVVAIWNQCFFHPHPHSPRHSGNINLQTMDYLEVINTSWTTSYEDITSIYALLATSLAPIPLLFLRKQSIETQKHPFSIPSINISSLRKLFFFLKVSKESVGKRSHNGKLSYVWVDQGWLVGERKKVVMYDIFLFNQNVSQRIFTQWVSY